jgi:hypothetical protein
METDKSLYSLYGLNPSLFESVSHWYTANTDDESWLRSMLEKLKELVGHEVDIYIQNVERAVEYKTTDGMQPLHTDESKVSIFPEDSNETLISLDDQEVMEKLDTEIGKMFLTDGIQSSNLRIVRHLLKCIEMAIKSSYIIRDQYLIHLLYYLKFGSISGQVKHIVKALIRNIRNYGDTDRDKLFWIYLCTSSQIPDVHRFYRQFLRLCGEKFDHARIIQEAIENGHEDYIQGRIGLKEFLKAHDKDCQWDEKYDLFYISLIDQEHSSDVLMDLEKKETRTEMREIIRNRIKHIAVQDVNRRPL